MSRRWMKMKIAFLFLLKPTLRLINRFEDQTSFGEQDAFIFIARARRSNQPKVERRKKKSRRLVHLVQPKVECWLQGEPDVQSNRLAALLSSSFTFGSPTLTKSSPTHNQSYSTEGWGWWKLVTNRRWSMKTSATIQSKIEDQPLLMITNQRLGIMVGLVAES